MLNSADLVAILSLSSCINFSSSSSACSDNVSGFDAACGPIQLLLVNAQALRLFVRLRLPLSTPNPIRAKLSPAGSRASGHKGAYHLWQQHAGHAPYRSPQRLARL